MIHDLSVDERINADGLSFDEWINAADLSVDEHFGVKLKGSIWNNELLG